MKRHAPATARNAEPLANVLASELPEKGLVLEIASGTGEHAVFLARRFPQLRWQPSDRDEGALDSIRAWASEAALENIADPILLDTASIEWPIEQKYRKAGRDKDAVDIGQNPTPGGYPDFPDCDWFTCRFDAPYTHDVPRGVVAEKHRPPEFINECSVAGTAVHHETENTPVFKRFCRKFAHVGYRRIVRLADEDRARRCFAEQPGPAQQRFVVRYRFIYATATGPNRPRKCLRVIEWPDFVR